MDDIGVFVEQSKKILLRLYYYSKSLTLLAEEYDIDLETSFWTIEMERDVLDHTMRVETVILGVHDNLTMDSDLGQQYIKENFEAAIRHQYLAFFETADHMCINTRLMLKNELTELSKDTIRAVWPDYYSIVRPEVDKISKKISEYRGKKDIPFDETITSIAEEYHEKAEQLIKWVCEMHERYSTMLEYEEKSKKEAKENAKSSIWAQTPTRILIAIIGILIAAIVRICLKT